MSDNVGTGVLDKIRSGSSPPHIVPLAAPGKRSPKDIFQDIANFFSTRLGPAASASVTPGALLAGAQAFQASAPNTGGIIGKGVTNIAGTTVALAGFYIFFAIAVVALVIILILAFSKLIGPWTAVLTFIIILILLMLIAFFMVESIKSTVVNGSAKLMADVKESWRVSGDTAVNNAIAAYTAALPSRPSLPAATLAGTTGGAATTGGTGPLGSLITAITG